METPSFTASGRKRPWGKHTSIVVPREDERIYKAINTSTGEVVESNDLAAVLRNVALSYRDGGKAHWDIEAFLR